MQTLLLDSDAVRGNAPIPELVAAVEGAFAAHARGDALMPAKSYVDLPRYDGDFRSMPSYLNVRGDGESGDTGGDGYGRGAAEGGRDAAGEGRDAAEGGWDAAGVKWVNVHTENRERFGLPTVMGTMVYSDPRNGFPLAILDGRELTIKRTGAAAAVATNHLAVSDARSLGIVGAGAQAPAQLASIAAVRPIEEVVVADRDDERVREFVDAFSEDFDVRGGSIAEAAACDVLSTVTPVEEPIVPRGAVGERTHINAMGADAAGKHELADEILLDAKLVIDDYEQCVHSGEINVPYSEGVLTDDDIDGELGEIVIGDRAGRTDDDGVTVFDSTGLAIQDVAAARVVYQRADADDEGFRFDLLGLDS